MSSIDSATRRRFERRSTDRLVAGVASGLADHLHVDPVVVRIGFIVFAVVGGAGILVYALCWLLVPERGAGESPAQRLLSKRWRGGAVVGVGLVVIAAALLAQGVGLWRPPILVAVVLTAVGIVLLRDEPVTASDPVSAPADTRTRPRLRFPRRRERSPLIWFTLGAVLVTFAGAGLLDRRGTLNLVVGQFPALALVVVGLGLVVGTWVGRSRILILVGMALIPVVAATSMVDFPLQGRIGDRWVMPTSAFDVAHPHRVLYGRTTFDLRRRALDRRVTTIDVSVAMGEVDVLVPRETAVEVYADIAYGQIYAFDRYVQGPDVRLHRRFGPDDAERSVRINVRGGVSSLGVQWRREWDPPRARRDERRGAGPRRDKKNERDDAARRDRNRDRSRDIREGNRARDTKERRRR